MKIKLIKLLVVCFCAGSYKEARALWKEHVVFVNGDPVFDKEQWINVSTPTVIRVGNVSSKVIEFKCEAGPKIPS